MNYLFSEMEELKSWLCYLEYLTSGNNGAIYRLDETILAKINFSIFNGYKCYENADRILSEIDLLKNGEAFVKNIYFDYVTTYERMIHIINRLSCTSCCKLIQGMVTYQDFLVAILLFDYGVEGYVSYLDIYSKFSIDQNFEVMERVSQKVLELMDNFIYPTDVKFGNVMVRARNLDVQIIDLDDRCTKYEESKNYLYYGQILNRIEKMKMKILQRK